MSNVTKGRKTKHRITKRRKLPKVEKQNVENYKTWKKKQNVENYMIGTVQYVKNPLAFFL